MDEKPRRKTGLSRIWAAFFYSLDGLRFAVLREAAFRQELIGIVLAGAVLPFLPVSAAWKGILLLSTSAILVVELLNSGIEKVVDLVSPDFHELAKRAKDLGSAAVLLSILTALALWLICIGDMLTSHPG